MAAANTGWWPLLWFTAKLWGFIFVYIWLRGTLPRLRYDQFMALGWKILIPVALTWVLLAAGMRSLRNDGYEVAAGTGGLSTLTTVVVLLALHRRFSALNTRRSESAPAPPVVAPEGSFPTPPLPQRPSSRAKEDIHG